MSAALKESPRDVLVPELAPAAQAGLPIRPSVGQRCWAALDAALAAPDLQPLLAGFSIAIDAALPVPFVVRQSLHIRLAPEALTDPAAARVMLRHAAEIATLAKDVERPKADAIARAVLAARVAALHLQALPAAERSAAEAGLPRGLLGVYGALLRGGPLAHVAAMLGPDAADLNVLLPLAGVGADDVPSIAGDLAARTGAANLLEDAFDLAAPAEVLISQGGDQRIAVDGTTGRNAYGGSPRPVTGEVSFASSTASSTSPRQLEAAEAVRGRLIRAALDGLLAPALAEETESVRRGVLGLAGAEGMAGTEAVLTASGTDAELIALAVVLALGEEPVTSILIDPCETGSGVPQAAGGRHFSARTAFGAVVQPGSPLTHFAEGRTDVVGVGLRDARGNPRPREEIDSEVEVQARAALAAGRHVVLHVLDAAKTGLGAPSLGLVDRLARDSRVTVLVDACQMRLGRPSMRAYLERGFLLQVTGSKFFCGPPFCGALLIPASIADRLAKAVPAPSALAAYSGRLEWPAGLAAFAGSLARGSNTGLLCRWQAALAEAEAFDSIPVAEARAFLDTFAAEAGRTIALHHELRAVAAPPFDRSSLGDDPLSGLQTIFPFTLLDPCGQALPPDHVKRVHRLLMRDLSGELGQASEAARTPVHLGQPVTLGGSSALRLCASARTVTDALLARGPEAVLDEMRLAVRKAALLARQAGLLS